MPSWAILGLVAALGAALVAIFGKLGLKDVDPVTATAARAVIMAAATLAAAALGQRLGGITGIAGGTWIWIVASGIAGAASWLAYFAALQTGQASAVSALDRLSVVFVVLIAALPFVGEQLTLAKVAGAALVVAGAVLISR